MSLFTQNEADYFRDAGIGDLNVYFRRSRRLAKDGDIPAGVVLFNLLEEIMVRNTRPFIRAAYPNATINGKPVVFPDRKLHTVEYDLGATYGGLYTEIVAEIERLSLAPYQIEVVQEEIGHPRRAGARVGERAGSGPGRHLQDAVSQAAGIEHLRLPRKPAPGPGVRGDVPRLSARRHGGFVAGFSEADAVPVSRRRGRPGSRQRGRGPGRRGRGESIPRQPAQGGPEPVRPAQAAARC